MARPKEPKEVPEELAQARSIRQIASYLLFSLEQRDRQIAEQLKRLDLKLDQLAALVEQYSQQAETAGLEATSFSVQANEVLRRLRAEVHAAPDAVVAALARRGLEQPDEG